MPLRELQEKTTSREFLEWLAFIDYDFNLVKKEEHYHARLAKLIFAVHGGKDKGSISDWLLDFKVSSDNNKPKYDMETSKMFWKSIIMG